MSSHRTNRTRRRLRLEQLDNRVLLARDSLYISEFLANNDSVLSDEDGQFSDWIELHNPTSSPIGLGGWSLTDSATEPRKWIFPQIEIPAYGYQVVFASSKNRRNPAEELHTNFKLSNDGEYLALVSPDQSIVHGFQPSFPAQMSDQSFGFPSEAVPLVQDDSNYAVLQPMENDAQDTAWRDQLLFDDRSWQVASGAIGFDVRRTDTENAGFENGDLAAWQSRGPIRTVDESFGVLPTEGVFMALGTTRDSTATRAGAEFALGLPSRSLERVNGGGVQRVSAVKREIIAEESTEVTLDWNYLTNDDRVGDFAFAYVSGETEIMLLADPVSDLVQSDTVEFSRETGFRRFTHTFATAGIYSVVLGVAEANDREGDSAILIDNLMIDGVGVVSQSYDSILDTTIPDLVNDTLWLRHEFHDESTDLMQQLLRIRYDDGFSAFINGELVASRNAPAELNWNSSATNAHPNEDAAVFEDFSISPSVLNAGDNLLAIQGLNHESDELDFLLDVSLIGVGMAADESQFLHTPTPGGPNLSTASDPTTSFANVDFSQSSGFYEVPFELTMSTDEPGATIRYTLDGSLPTAENGLLYQQPVEINSTAVVQAAVFKNGLSGSTTTASYLFVESILNQSVETAIAAGFPDGWTDYEFDPNVIGPNDSFDGKYAETIRDDLLSLPSLSLVMNSNDLFGEQGIYTNRLSRGDEWERFVSAELINPGQPNGFQINSGIRIHGGASRFSSKPSFRLLFRESYGDGKLIDPVFGESGPTELDSLVLRSSTSEGLAGRFHYIRDETVRRLESAIGNPSAKGMFVHLYLNGFYWGLFNLIERVDAQFAVSRHGGSEEEYDMYAPSDALSSEVVATHGNLDAWQKLLSLARDVASAPNENLRTIAYMKLLGKNADGTDNPKQEAYLDVDNLINYLVANLYAGNTDWPSHNYYMYRRRGPNSEGFKFVVWDAEFTLDVAGDKRVSQLENGHVEIVKSLLTSEAFRVRFSDRVQELVSPGGALYVNPESPQWDPNQPDNNKPAEIYAEVANVAHAAIVAESARWGDVISVPAFTRDESWLPTVESNLREFFPNRTASFLDNLRSDDVYRDAPELGLRPGRVDNITELQLTSANDPLIYYTTDGSDPRLPDGNISPNATRYLEPIPLAENTLIRTRSLDGAKWSAIVEGQYVIDESRATSENLRITEVHYHPSADGASEFIELMNISSSAISLEGVTVEGGVTFEFDTSQVVRILPAQRLVIVRDRNAFFATYPELEDIVAGQYYGNLSNGGEKLTLRGADDAIIQEFEYRDDGDWPTLADGGGPSLQLIALSLDANVASNWRASAVPGGTPGRPEYIVGDVNLDGLFNSHDLVLVFQAAEYEDTIKGNSIWTTGDWTGDAEFTTRDLVLAFQSGHYVAGARGFA